MSRLNANAFSFVPGQGFRTPPQAAPAPTPPAPIERPVQTEAPPPPPTNLHPPYSYHSSTLTLTRVQRTSVQSTEYRAIPKPDQTDTTRTRPKRDQTRLDQTQTTRSQTKPNPPQGQEMGQDRSLASSPSLSLVPHPSSLTHGFCPLLALGGDPRPERPRHE